MNTKLLVVIVLGILVIAGGFAYSQGWFAGGGNETVLEIEG